MYQHAWESVLSFCDLSDLSRAIRTQRLSLSAIKQMKPLQMTFSCNLNKMQQMCKHTLMMRHIGFICYKGNDVYNALLTAAELGTVITSFEMNGTLVNEYHRIHLTDMLKTNTSISSVCSAESTTFSLKCTHARILACALRANTSITCIDLHNNTIKPPGAIMLADAFLDNTSITTVRIQKNPLGDDGMLALAEALKDNTSITSIHLEETYTTCKGALAIADMLKINTSITWLHLGGNQIRCMGAGRLAEALLINTSITTFDLSSNFILQKGIQALNNAIQVTSSRTIVLLDPQR